MFKVIKGDSHTQTYYYLSVIWHKKGILKKEEEEEEEKGKNYLIQWSGRVDGRKDYFLEKKSFSWI